MWYNVRTMEDRMLEGRKSTHLYPAGPHMGLLLVCLLVPGFALTFACAESEVPSPAPEAVTPNACWNPEAPDTAECTVPDKVTVIGKNFYPSIERALDENAEFTFEEGFRITLIPQESDGEAMPVALKNIVYHTPQTLEATVPDGIPPGTYRVKVETPFGLSGATKQGVFTINGEPQASSDADADGDGDTDADGDSAHIDIPVNYSCPAAQTCENTCSGDRCGFACASDTLCDYECFAAECAAECLGTGRCDLTCNADNCDMLCNGAGPCDLTCQGRACSATNTGYGLLTVNCRTDECEVSCPTDSGGCVLVCEGEGCTPSDCAAGWRACADNVYACNTACP